MGAGGLGPLFEGISQGYQQAQQMQLYGRRLRLDEEETKGKRKLLELQTKKAEMEIEQLVRRPETLQQLMGMFQSMLGGGEGSPEGGMPQAGEGTPTAPQSLADLMSQGPAATPATETPVAMGGGLQERLLTRGGTPDAPLPRMQAAPDVMAEPPRPPVSQAPGRPQAGGTRLDVLPSLSLGDDGSVRLTMGTQQRKFEVKHQTVDLPGVGSVIMESVFDPVQGQMVSRQPIGMPQPPEKIQTYRQAASAWGFPVGTPENDQLVGQFARIEMLPTPEAKAAGLQGLEAQMAQQRRAPAPAAGERPRVSAGREPPGPSAPGSPTAPPGLPGYRDMSTAIQAGKTAEVQQAANVAAARTRAELAQKPLEGQERERAYFFMDAYDIGRAMVERFTPEQRKQYVGAFGLRVRKVGVEQAIKDVFDTEQDPKFHEFAVLMSRGQALMFGPGGKALTATEQEILGGVFPSGKEWSRGAFEAKLPSLIDVARQRTQDILTVGATPRKDVGGQLERRMPAPQPKAPPGVQGVEIPTLGPAAESLLNGTLAQYRQGAVTEAGLLALATQVFQGNATVARQWVEAAKGGRYHIGQPGTPQAPRRRIIRKEPVQP